MSLDSVPIWVLLLATIGLVALSLEAGVRLGKRRQLRAGGKAEVSGAMVGATMALLAFMVAFTFNGAAGRHDARKALVIEEANAIDKTWRRAGFLTDPYRADIRGLLRKYVDVRVKAAGGEVEMLEAIRRSEALHDKMWALAEEVAKKDIGARAGGLFIQALNDLPIDPSITAHSIVAVLGDGPVAGKTDGVVAYESAHIDGVASELVVRSGHSTQGRPETIEEVRQILREHIGAR